jgi:hypothetical protein
MAAVIVLAVDSVFEAIQEPGWCSVELCFAFQNNACIVVHGACGEQHTVIHMAKSGAVSRFC